MFRKSGYGQSHRIWNSGPPTYFVLQRGDYIIGFWDRGFLASGAGVVVEGRDCFWELKAELVDLAAEGAVPIFVNIRGVFESRSDIGVGISMGSHTYGVSGERRWGELSR